jgi:hypothetical protein
MLHVMNIRMGGSYEKPPQNNARDDLLEIWRACWKQHEDLYSWFLDFFPDSFTSWMM